MIVRKSVGNGRENRSLSAMESEVLFLELEDTLAVTPVVGIYNLFPLPETDTLVALVSFEVLLVTMPVPLPTAFAFTDPAVVDKVT